MFRKSFIGSAMIMILSGFIVKLFGFVYRVYLSNLIGAEGMGLFQLIAPLYSLIILTLTSGISIAVSKMVAREAARKNIINLERITNCALILVSCAGILVSVVLYSEINFITHTILKDERTYYSLLLLIPCIPVIAAASAIKGYFYGMQDMIPTALSQIAEQVVRIALVMFTAGYFIHLGLEYVCALATIGILAGEISNLAVVYIIYRVRKKKLSKNVSRRGIIPKRKIVKEILGISLPVSSNRFITSAMMAVELILIPRKLMESGLDYQNSMEVFGKLTGMAVPLLFFPALITSSLAVTLVPAISEALSLKNYKSVNRRISKSIQIAFILGFLFTAVFTVFPDEISNIVYTKADIGELLYLLAFSCIFIYLQQTLVGIMNGLDKQSLSLRNSITGYVIRILFVLFLVPVYGIRSYIWGIIASTACVCSLNMYIVIKTTGIALDIRNWIIKPGITGVAMLFSGKYLYRFFILLNMQYKATVVITLFTHVVSGIFLMFFMGLFKKEEIISMLGYKKRRKISKI